MAWDGPVVLLDSDLKRLQPKPFKAPKTTVAAALVASLLFSKWVRKKRIEKVNYTTDLSGKTVLVTGGNTGIGRVTAMLFAKRNATVIIGCRNEADGSEAVSEIKRATGNKNVSCKKLDLCSFNSVRHFVEEVKEAGDVNILINNAGIISSGGKRIITEDGCERVMQANYYGHFLLTMLLTDVMKKSAPSRIVNVTSYGHKWGHLNFKDINSLDNYDESVYYKSKLANVLFTRELSRRLMLTGVTVNVVDPGLTKTNYVEKAPSFRGFILKIIYMFYGKTPFEGAQTAFHVAMSSELQGASGKYFSNCKERKLQKAARDWEEAATLFERSQYIVGLK